MQSREMDRKLEVTMAYAEACKEVITNSVLTVY